MSKFRFFDEYELLELFCSYPFYADKEADIYGYEYTDKFGYTLSFQLSVHEQSVIVGLREKRLINPIFDLCFENVDYISGDGEKLTLHLESGKKVYIFFKPSFALEFESDLSSIVDL